MNQPKKIITGSLLIVIFVLIVSMSSWYVWNEMYFGDVCSCAMPLPILIPVLASIGLLTGTFAYYIFSPKFERKLVDKNTVLKLFSGTENKIMDALVENRGELSQARIGSLTGLSKVNVFRSLEKLLAKGIIEKEKKGKTNTIRLADDIKQIFE